MNHLGKWDGNTTLKFISLYRKHTCLWDFKSVNYRNQQTRISAYIALANAMNIPGFGIPEVKSKIKNLRSTFSQELKKIRDTNNEYEPNLKWFKEMEDIYKEMLLKKEGYDVAGHDEETNYETHEQKVESDSEEIETEMLEEEFTEETPKKKPKMSIRNPSEFLKITHTDPLTVNTDILDSSYDIFGRSVAAQLKKLSQENALLAKCKIQSVLTEFGIKDLREKGSLNDSVDRKWGDGTIESSGFSFERES